LQWPKDDNGPPIEIVKVIRVVYHNDDPQRQWGAYVQPWELSTSLDKAACYIKDPWHAHAAHKTGQSYKKNFPARAQPWTYLLSTLSEFQDEVRMTTRWSKPKGWNKALNGGAAVARGVPRINITHRDQAKVRNFIHRYQQRDMDVLSGEDDY
jgi:hypothetical protein